MTAYYLIKRGMFYRPKAEGYTYVASEAGIFSADEAARHVAGCSGEVTMVPVPPKPVDPLVYWTRQLLATLPAKRDWLDPVIEANLKELTK